MVIKNELSGITKHLILVLLLSGVSTLLAQVPVVKFGAKVRVVEQYGFTQIFDSSTNNPTQWEWNIFDSTTYKSLGYYPTLNDGLVYSDPQSNGNNEFSKNPEFGFGVPGKYTVTLRCKNSSGWSAVLVKKEYIICGFPSIYHLGQVYGNNNDNIVDIDSGKIFDGGGPNYNYDNNMGIKQFSYLTIRPCRAKKITLTMSQLKFADANDILYVYDGEVEDNNKLLAAWTKNNTSAKRVIALSGSMHLVFQSDGSGVDSGFAGSYISELDTNKGSPLVKIMMDSLIYNATPFVASYSGVDIFGSPTFNWTIDGNQVAVNTKKNLRYTSYQDGKHVICLNVNHCYGIIKTCDSFKVKMADKKTQINFTASSQYTNALESVVLTPVTDNANNFKWIITPNSFTILNPPGAPSSYDSTSVTYSSTPGDSLPRPRIRFLDSVCYTIQLIAHNSMDPTKTVNTLSKYNYICGKDFREVYSLYGTVYHDVNSNCLKSVAESGIRNVQIKLYDSSNQLIDITYSLENGLFGFERTRGTYKILMNIGDLPMKLNCPTGADTVVTLNKINPFNGLDFAMTCDAKLDLGVRTMYCLGRVFPGKQHTLVVSAGAVNKFFALKCLAPVKSGSVKIKVSGKIKYQGVAAGAKTPSSIAGDVYTYNISDFMKVDNNNDFRLIFKTDTNATLTDLVRVSVEVLPVSGEADTSNNRKECVFWVGNSYDPNLKEVYPKDVPLAYHDWLTYMIHFQNTGNAPAYNIRLEDTLDNELDLETFEIIGFSHQNRISLKNNVLRVYYDDIMLPDSTSDYKGSMGFIQYRVKPKSQLPIGTRIENTAYIYFDYNSPIVTNTTINEFVKTNNDVTSLHVSGIKVYPNPGNGVYHIENPGGQQSLIEIYNVMGEMVLSKTIGLNAEIDLSSYPTGIYLFKVLLPQNVEIVKVLKH